MSRLRYWAGAAALLCGHAGGAQPAATPRSVAQPAEGPRQQLAADAGWRFHLGDPSGAEAPAFVDAGWRRVDLPHDWSIEGRPDTANRTGGGGGYFPAGIGWYRKTFAAPAGWRGKRVSVEFDGVYMDATVYLNGRKLATHPNGYTSFALDLTPYLAVGGPNVLAVRVDNSAQPNSRWYTGSGIYRHVRLVVTEPTHVAHWGVFVTTPQVADSAARVRVRTRVSNAAGAGVNVTVRTALLGPTGAVVGEARSDVAAPADSAAEVTQDVRVAHPALWSPDTPRLYRAVTRVVQGGRVVDEVVTPFGVRSIAWSAERGFVLNGRPVELHGGSVHHDNGPLGAAAFDRAEERKAELLKAAGMNAVRTAHNPPSPAFLDACDRLGLLVLDETFDVWTLPKVKHDFSRIFAEWWQRDLDAMVLRDRNHPSVVLWGIGNEIPDVFTGAGTPIARRLAARVRALDPTRPVTQAFPGATYTPNVDSAIAAVDVAGYNYNLAENHEKDHARVPTRLMLATETFASAAFEQWRLARDLPYVIGDFVWAAMDYLGESGIGAWRDVPAAQAGMGAIVQRGMKKQMVSMGEDGRNPMPLTDENTKPNPVFPGYPWHAGPTGDLDLTGFRKAHSYYREVLWNGGDRVVAAVRRPEPEGMKTLAFGWAVFPTVRSWTWPGQEGRALQVEVYAGTDSARLYLNERLLGTQPTGRAQEFKATFSVPYAPGTLRAVGVRGGREVATSVLTTAGAPVRLRLTPDRAAVRADGQDLSFVAVEAVDAEGRPQPDAEQQVEFSIDGPGVIAAVGNGDGRSTEPYQGTRRALFGGRALVVVRAARGAGPITLTASAPGLHTASLTLRAQVARPHAELR